jgi:hypothetical protein
MSRRILAQHRAPGRASGPLAGLSPRTTGRLMAVSAVVPLLSTGQVQAVAEPEALTSQSTPVVSHVNLDALVDQANTLVLQDGIVDAANTTLMQQQQVAAQQAAATQKAVSAALTSGRRRPPCASADRPPEMRCRPCPLWRRR